MPDSGENGEIRERINAKEAEIELEEAKLRERPQSILDRAARAKRRRTAKKATRK